MAEVHDAKTMPSHLAYLNLRNEMRLFHPDEPTHEIIGLRSLSDLRCESLVSIKACGEIRAGSPFRRALSKLGEWRPNPLCNPLTQRRTGDFLTGTYRCIISPTNSVVQHIFLVSYLIIIEKNTNDVHI